MSKIYTYMNIVNQEIMTLFQIDNYQDLNRLAMYKFDPFYKININKILLNNFIRSIITALQLNNNYIGVNICSIAQVHKYNF